MAQDGLRKVPRIAPNYRCKTTKTKNRGRVTLKYNSSDKRKRREFGTGHERLTGLVKAHKSAKSIPYR